MQSRKRKKFKKKVVPKLTITQIKVPKKLPPWGDSPTPHNHFVKPTENSNIYDENLPSYLQSTKKFKNWRWRGQRKIPKKVVKKVVRPPPPPPVVKPVRPPRPKTPVAKVLTVKIPELEP